MISLQECLRLDDLIQCFLIVSLVCIFQAWCKAVFQFFNLVIIFLVPRRRLNSGGISYLLLLPFVCTIACVSTPGEGLLDRRSWFRCDIEFGKLGSHLEDVHTGSVEYLFGRWDGDCEICVFGQACDEEHEATGFDLHFCKVCATGGDICVFSMGSGWLVWGSHR